MNFNFCPNGKIGELLVGVSKVVYKGLAGTPDLIVNSPPPNVESKFAPKMLFVQLWKWISFKMGKSVGDMRFESDLKIADCF